MKLSKLFTMAVGIMTLFLSANVLEVQAASYKPYEEASYELTYETGEDGGIVITGYTGTAEGELVLPGEIDGVKVTEIGASAFYTCEGFTGRLVIPDGIKKIGDWAFQSCSGLTGSLRIPESVTSIGSYAFRGCVSMLPQVYLTDNTKDIAENAFLLRGGYYADGVVIFAPIGSYGEIFAKTYHYTYAEWDGGQLVCENDEWIYVVDGVIDTTETGLVRLDDDAWFYVTEGKLDETKNGFVEYNGGSFYVAEGRVVTEANGLVEYEDEWYFVSNGQVQEHHTGLAQYDGEWFYISEGKLDTELADFVAYDDSYFLVAAGRIAKEANGLIEWPSRSNILGYVAEGQIQTQFSGLVYYDEEWFSVSDGFMDSYSGLLQYEDKIFLFSYGQLKKDFTGIWSGGIGSSTNYYIVNGMIQDNYTGLVQDRYYWYAIENGRYATYPEVTIFSYEGMNYYCKWGRFDSTYNGYFTYEDITYHVVNGIATPVE